MHNRAAHARQRLPIAEVIAAFTPASRLGTPLQPVQNRRHHERVANPIHQPRYQLSHAVRTPGGDDARRPRSFRRVLAQRAVMNPERELAQFGASLGASSQADFKPENGIRGRAPERQPVRVQDGRGKVVREWRSVACVEPHSGLGMKRW